MHFFSTCKVQVEFNSYTLQSHGTIYGYRHLVDLIVFRSAVVFQAILKGHRKSKNLEITGLMVLLEFQFAGDKWFRLGYITCPTMEF